MRGAAGSSRQTRAALFCSQATRLAVMLHPTRPAAMFCLTRLAVMTYGAFLLVAPAAAFPLSDVTNPSVVPSASAAASAAAPDASDASALAHQQQLLSPFGGAVVGPGWTFTPSLTLQEALNDNVFQTESDRRWDLISYVTPGLAISGDTQNVQLRFEYQPTLEYYARNSSLNQLAQQLNAIGDVTLWQDHLYLDLRAMAGLASASGSVPGQGFGGTTGQPNNASIGLTRQNSTQFTSFAASPYFLQQFDTYGTLKLGYTLSYSSTSNAAGLVPLPLNSTGPAATQITNEGVIQYTTGTFLERTSDTVLIDAKQFRGTGETQSGHSDTATNQVNYVLNREIAVFGAFGYEDINYGGINALAIHDLTWQVGTTLTPNARSTLTMSYGHQQGADSLSVSGLYAATPRTSVNVSFSQQLGTELQSLETQLAAADINNTGTLVNSRTGAPLVTNNNVLGTATQLYRSETANFGTTTQLDRDTISINLQYAAYTAAGAGASGSTNGVTGTANWTHSLRDDLTLNGSVSYGLRWFTDPGGRNNFAATAASLRYAISATLSSTLSYTFYDLNSTDQGQSLYEDVLLLSLTKQF